LLAVSGGVDSMVLLDVINKLAEKNSKFSFIVAHFDHGIRPSSNEDMKFVRAAANIRGLQFVYKVAHLGPGASEEQARNARYDFLKKQMRRLGADAIITAHHQDDVMETAVINIIRGTSPRGLVSLASTANVIRPFLSYTKEQLLEYAKNNHIAWREDPSNQDIKYLRNYVRHNILARLSQDQKDLFIKTISSTKDRMALIDNELSGYFGMSSEIQILDRYQFILLPHSVSREVMAEWLRRNGITNINTKMIERLVVVAKTYSPGSIADINKAKVVKVGQRKLELLDR